VGSRAQAPAEAGRGLPVSGPGWLELAWPGLAHLAGGLRRSSAPDRGARASVAPTAGRPLRAAIDTELAARDAWRTHSRFRFSYIFSSTFFLWWAVSAPREGREGTKREQAGLGLGGCRKRGSWPAGQTGLWPMAYGPERKCGVRVGMNRRVLLGGSRSGRLGGRGATDWLGAQARGERGGRGQAPGWQDQLAPKRGQPRPGPPTEPPQGPHLLSTHPKKNSAQIPQRAYLQSTECIAPSFINCQIVRSQPSPFERLSPRFGACLFGARSTTAQRPARPHQDSHSPSITLDKLAPLLTVDCDGLRRFERGHCGVCAE